MLNADSQTVNERTAAVRALPGRFVICLCFGALFFAIEEFCQSTLVKWDYGCCERCGNYLYDCAQPVLALCATLACYCYLWKFSASFSFKKSLRSAVVSGTTFLAYFLYIGAKIYFRTECTALYSPGPGFLHSVVIGGSIVAFVLLAESAAWSSICIFLLLILGGVTKVFRPAEPIVSLSISSRPGLVVRKS
jgi:hypothetical protein